jgi:hypothetical protein
MYPSCKEERLSIDGALKAFPVLKGIMHPEVRLQSASKIKGENLGISIPDVSLVIGGSVTAFQLYVRRSRSAGETSTASQPFAPGLRRFFICY